MKYEVFRGRIAFMDNEFDYEDLYEASVVNLRNHLYIRSSLLMMNS